MGKIIVLRLGHRVARDKRVTTHVALTARALGADGIILSGERDERLTEGLKKFVKRWGGQFEVSYEEKWRKVLEKWKACGGAVIHLTVYGINLPDIIEELRKVWMNRDFMVVVGSEKVPREVYEAADYNVAISNQPHSEIAALAIFLDWLQKGKELNREFPDAKIKIIPQKKGKKVVKIHKSGQNSKKHGPVV